MKRTAENLILIARKEIGYHEKASNCNLDSKTDNKGSNNFTKYGRDLFNAGYYNGNKNGFAWCDQMVDWLFWNLCDRNKEEAEKMTCQTGVYGAGVDFSAKYYEQQGRLDSHPRVGDQAFFGKRQHTGIVSAVNGNLVTVIEGNKKDQVSENTYIIGQWLSNEFGHPFYEDSEDKPNPAPGTSCVYTLEMFVRDVQIALGANVDGIAGPNTLSHTITVSSSKNRTHPVVVPLQKRLEQLGYYKSGIDGKAGPGFTMAVKNYQKDHRTQSDGIITEKQITWKNLLGIDCCENNYSQKQFVRDVQVALGANVDGIPGPNTLEHTITVSKHKNRTHPVVLPLQKKLKSIGLYTGNFDGEAGNLFDAAVKRYQHKIDNPNIDGELTKGQRTWKKILGM